MSEQGWVLYAWDFVEDSRAHGEGWPDIVVDLRGEGIEEEVIAEVLRDNQARVEEAREWKQHGYPYEEIVQHLRDDVAAPWGDVAHALMEVGLAPADILRLVLPQLGEDDPLPLVRVVLAKPHYGSAEEEAREVVDYFFPGIAKEGRGDMGIGHPAL